MFLSFLAVFTTFLATILLLLVSLSVPILKSIALFSLSIGVGSGAIIKASINAVLTFGVWGFCNSGVDVSVFGSSKEGKTTCSAPQLGYQIDSATASTLQLDDLTNVVSKGFTAVLALHPVACGLALISFIVTLFALLRRRRHLQTYGTEWDGLSRFTPIIAFAIILPAAVVTTVVLLVDVALVAIARRSLRTLSNGTVQLTWDSAVWMTLVAALALWIALLATIYPCGSRFRSRKRTTY